MSGLIGLLIALIVAAVIFGAAVWIIEWIAPPPPLVMPIKAVVGLILLLYLLGLLVGYVPPPTHFWHS